jgi:beta-lactamase class A
MVRVAYVAMIKRFLLAGASVLATCGAVQAQHPALRQEIAQLARASSGKVGVSIRLLETNDTVSYHDRQPYVLQSVFKLAIGMAVLHKVDRGKLQLEQPLFITKADLPETYSPLRNKYPEGNVHVTVRQLLTYMVTVSDNDACDILLKQLGGPRKLTAYVHHLGVKNMVVKASEAQMAAAWPVQYTNWSYPSAQIELLNRVYQHTALSKTSNAVLWQLLLDTSVGAKRLKGLLPAGTAVAHRTGTSATNAQGLSPGTNDVGIIMLPNGQHLAIAVFVTDAHEDIAARELVIARIAKAAYDEFAR